MEKKKVLKISVIKNLDEYVKDIRIGQYAMGGTNIGYKKAVDVLREEISRELSKAREEVIKDLIKKIEEAHCDSISLELLKEIELSKLKESAIKDGQIISAVDGEGLVHTFVLKEIKP